MPLDDQLQADVRATFQVELEDHCRTLSGAFLALEKEPEPDERQRLLDTAFRSAHNIKGAARAVGLAAIEALAHRAEGVLAAARRDELELSPALFDLLYAAVDSLGSAASDQVSASDDRLATITQQLGVAHAGQLQQAAPSGAELPTNHPAPRASTPETLRVSSSRLDMVLDQLGELVLPRLEIEAGLAELSALRGQTDTWHREWRKLRPRLRQLEREGLLANVGAIIRFLEINADNLAELGPRLSAVHARLSEPTAQLGTLTQDLHFDVKGFRMLPFGQLGEFLERALRDLTRSLAKDARLVLIGSEAELDRRALEDLKDPLVHLLRNAVDHGIETPAARQRLGKPAIGSIVVTATQRGSAIVIEVEDDGAGISSEVIRQAAADRGLATPGELAAMTERQVLRLVFAPGFSTRTDVSEVSGRGVGLDVVARNVEQLGGRVDVESKPGTGTRFVLTVPLTLATTRALLVEAGGALYALPTATVERVLRPERLGYIGGRPVLEHEGATIPVIPLASVLQAGDGSALLAAGSAPVLALVSVGAQRVALAIDRMSGEQEIVVKPLPFPVQQLPNFGGATILGSGRVVPILNAADLMRAVSNPHAMLPETRPTGSQRKQLRVLVADDSLTTRTLERYILEAAGYTVDLAGDGAEALSRLQEQGCDVLVSDVDMPALDGVELTKRVRAHPGLRDLPVILVTSLDSAEDRERGLEAGADAYVVKSSFDQDQLLRTIQELV